MSTTSTHNSITGSNDWKPRLSQHIRLEQPDGHYVLNQTELGYQLSINPETWQLLEQLDGSRSVTDIAADIEQSSGSHTDATSLRLYLIERFAKKGFIESDMELRPRPQATFLTKKFPVARRQLVQRLNLRWCYALFHPVTFYVLFALLFAVNLWFLVAQTRSGANLRVSSPLLLGGLFFSHFIHEWGHAAAAKRFGVKPGEIGFGLYYILPVFYVDLSDAWNATRAQRIIINLAGIYIEYLLTLVCYVIYLFTKDPFFVLLPLLIFVKSWYNLNPLLRTDMYWVLSDYFRRPNLNENAMLAFRQLLRRPRSIAALERSGRQRQYVMALYGGAITGFWLYLLGGFMITGSGMMRQMPDVLSQVTGMVRAGTYDLKVLFFAVYNILFILFALFIFYKLILFIWKEVKKYSARKRAGILAASS
jgi:putative peptide zinc metalloprotease protein